MSTKRTLEDFFSPSSKKPRGEKRDTNAEGDHDKSNHPKYPFPISNLPTQLATEIHSLPAREGRQINDKPGLDLLYFRPYIPEYMATRLFKFLRAELPFYRVEYKIKRGGFETQIRTPRWTTVFGLDETSIFGCDGHPVDQKTLTRVSDRRYEKIPPRSIPACLDQLRISTEKATGCTFNFCLVNYYASGTDSISYHSDDERFLGNEPAIASFSLGARRDFLMKPKSATEAQVGRESVRVNQQSIKLALSSGDMVLMRGKTQSSWLHSIPKRAGRNHDEGGRINITFRKAMVKDGTDNYYNYNVGNGPVFRWDDQSRTMAVWQP